MQIHSRLSVHGHERSRAAGAVGLHGSRGCEGLQNASLQIEKETSRSSTHGTKIIEVSPKLYQSKKYNLPSTAIVT